MPGYAQFTPPTLGHASHATLCLLCYIAPPTPTSWLPSLAALCCTRQLMLSHEMSPSHSKEVQDSLTSCSPLYVSLPLNVVAWRLLNYLPAKLCGWSLMLFFVSSVHCTRCCCFLIDDRWLWPSAWRQKKNCSSRTTQHITRLVLLCWQGPVHAKNIRHNG